jgi:lantibiotic modifying enzyme
MPAYRAQTLAFYDGTAGIAFFLGRLMRLTKDPLQRTTLIGALNHIGRATEELDYARTLGFYRGAAGIAAVLISAGEALEDDRWVNRGFMLLERQREIEPDPTRPDVMRGSAGTILAFLEMGLEFGRDDMIAAAKAHGDVLLRSTVRSELGWSWDDPEAGRGPFLDHVCSAGSIACALLELHRVTCDDRYLEGALEGLRFERSQFGRPSRNESNAGPSPMPHAHSAPEVAGYPVAWCRGAVEVGFSRLRIRELLGNSNDLNAELEAALERTQLALRQPFGPGQGFCLCHGAAGLADLLIEAGDALARTDLHQMADAVGRMGIATFQQSDLPWPCGVPVRGETPNLMLGLSGIGYFYLRLYSPETVPSVLVLKPELFARQKQFPEQTLRRALQVAS